MNMIQTATQATYLWSFNWSDDLVLVLAFLLAVGFLIRELAKSIKRRLDHRLIKCGHCKERYYAYKYKPLDQCPNRDCRQSRPLRKSRLAKWVRAKTRKRKHKAKPGKRIRALARRSSSR